jgi:hypothetical protein
MMRSTLCTFTKHTQGVAYGGELPRNSVAARNEHGQGVGPEHPRWKAVTVARRCERPRSNNPTITYPDFPEQDF